MVTYRILSEATMMSAVFANSKLMSYRCFESDKIVEPALRLTMSTFKLLHNSSAFTKISMLLYTFSASLLKYLYIN